MKSSNAKKQLVFSMASIGGDYEPPAGLHLILAGGLRPENVVQAIAELQPWGVDVSSGVEASPGKKSPERLTQFIENARATVSP